MRYNLNTMNLHDLKQLEPEDIEALPIPGELKDYSTMLLERIDLLSDLPDIPG